MSRPKKGRLVCTPPVYGRFKPVGIAAKSLKSMVLSLDEYEALRLADYEGMDHLEAAEEMGISRSTFSRLIEKSRKKLSTFMIEGKQLIISGGNIHFRDNRIKCYGCGHMFNISIEDEIKACPSCGSTELVDLAGGYGHGRCCRGGFQHRNRRGFNKI